MQFASRDLKKFEPRQLLLPQGWAFWPASWTADSTLGSKDTGVEMAETPFSIINGSSGYRGYQIESYDFLCWVSFLGLME